MAKRKRTVRPVLGDVVEIRLSSGFAYAQYVNHHKQFYGELIRILPGTFEEQLTDEEVPDLCKRTELYYCFYPLNAAIRAGHVRIIDKCSIPTRCRKMPNFKMYFENPDTVVKTWFVWDGKSAKPKRVSGLSLEERKYPMEEVVAYSSLVEMIESGWLPEHEAD
jgi:hypothetical protein